MRWRVGSTRVHSTRPQRAAPQVLEGRDMNTQHDPYASTSWRRAALAVLVALVATAAVFGLALALGLELKF